MSVSRSEYDALHLDGGPLSRAAERYSEPNKDQAIMLSASLADDQLRALSIFGRSGAMT